MSFAQPPSNRPKPNPEASTKPAKPVKRPKKPDPADYPPLPPMLELTGNTPIPPASEPLQYRAIGLILGKYLPSMEEFNQGVLLADDGTAIDAVILGRIMSLIKNHIDLVQSHLWVVYPRIRKEDNKLHAQIMGVWDPKLVLKPLTEAAEAEETEAPAAPTIDLADIPSIESMGIPPNFFSIRGEVIYQSRETKEIFVKIRQAPKKKNEELRYFKIRLVGDLPQKMVGSFWDFDALREGDNLVLRSAQFIASLKAKPPKKGGGKPPGDGSKKPYKKPMGDGERTGSYSNREAADKSKPAPMKRSLPPKLELPDNQ
jgi:hypothetical protein